MEHRKVTLFNGKTYKVPMHIVRLDSEKVHGWQVRYGKSKLFSDHSNDGSGARASLREASAELARRIAKLPAPTGLPTVAREGKGNDMPLGVSGPISRQRAGGGAVEYYLQVTYPVAGAKSVNRSVYIATENTLSREKYRAALSKAIEIRESGVRRFKLATTKAKRQAAGVSASPA
jgi:hypothetical protein